MRTAFVILHRYVGLALAVFLIIIGLTGSVIAFFPVLDRALNPDLLRVTPGQVALDPLALREKLQAADPQAHIYFISFPEHADEALRFYAEGEIDTATKEEYSLTYDELFANPYTGARLGQRLWGHFSTERQDLLTFLYYLHYSLVLPEALGETFMGIVALVWAFDCFVGFYLTLPARRKRTGANKAPRTFWHRWKPAWLIRMTAGRGRFYYDLHRASGLWVWPMLLVFAWSGFGFNLPRTYAAVMSRVTDYVDIGHAPELAQPLVRPAVGWQEALALGQHYMQEQAERNGFAVEKPIALVYRRETGKYLYKVRSSRDIYHHYGATTVTIDAADGRFLGIEIPTGQHAGNTFTTWIMALHTATVFGLPMQVFVCAMGLIVVTLTVSGVAVWWIKQRSLGAGRADFRTGPRTPVVTASGTCDNLPH